MGLTPKQVLIATRRFPRHADLNGVTALTPPPTLREANLSGSDRAASPALFGASCQGSPQHVSADLRQAHASDSAVLEGTWPARCRGWKMPSPFNTKVRDLPVRYGTASDYHLQNGALRAGCARSSAPAPTGHNPRHRPRSPATGDTAHRLDCRLNELRFAGQGSGQRPQQLGPAGELPQTAAGGRAARQGQTNRPRARAAATPIGNPEQGSRSAVPVS